MVDLYFIPFSKIIKYNCNDVYDIYVLVDYIGKKWSWQINVPLTNSITLKNHIIFRWKETCFPFPFQECDKCKR